MKKICVFCGGGGKLTGEHIFGSWLSKIGLSNEPAVHGSGPLNRNLREMGTTPPFLRTVREICSQCNNGWMSKLEDVAKRVLTPLILNEPGEVPVNDRAAIARWIQKTALVSLLQSSDKERAGGYGLPVTEYHNLYELRNEVKPLPNTQFWIGHYKGQRIASIWVTPMVILKDGEPHSEPPHAYIMTIVVGSLLLQGVRLTSDCDYLSLKAENNFQQIWPSLEDLSWPRGEVIDDEGFVGICKGENLIASESRFNLIPWGPATDLPESEMVGRAIKLPMPCGIHFAFYPAILVQEAMRGIFYFFVTSCDCGKYYLAKTGPDAVSFKIEVRFSTIADLQEYYRDLPGTELVLHEGGERFECKRSP